MNDINILCCMVNCFNWNNKVIVLYRPNNKKHTWPTWWIIESLELLFKCMVWGNWIEGGRFFSSLAMPVVSKVTHQLHILAPTFISNLRQYWPRFMSSYGAAGSQWIKHMYHMLIYSSEMCFNVAFRSKFISIFYFEMGTLPSVEWKHFVAFPLHLLKLPLLNRLSTSMSLSREHKCIVYVL